MEFSLNTQSAADFQLICGQVDCQKLISESCEDMALSDALSHLAVDVLEIVTRPASKARCKCILCHEPTISCCWQRENQDGLPQGVQIHHLINKASKRGKTQEHITSRGNLFLLLAKSEPKWLHPEEFRLVAKKQKCFSCINTDRTTTQSLLHAETSAQFVRLQASLPGIPYYSTSGKPTSDVPISLSGTQHSPRSLRTLADHSQPYGILYRVGLQL